MKLNGRAVRILIADGHTLFREALRALLEQEDGFEVVGEAAEGHELVEAARRLAPDVVLLELNLDTLRRLRKQAPEAGLIVLVPAITAEQAVDAVAAGAAGIVLKDSPVPMLGKSVRAVAAGEYWIGRSLVAGLVDAVRGLALPEGRKPEVPSAGLTAREKEIASAILDGCTNREVAKMFSISEQTVKHHLTSIFVKLGVSSRLELALSAVHRRPKPTGS